MKNNELEVALTVIRHHYGRKITIEKCKEELQELIQALNNNDYKNVHEEIADVYNILSHLKAYYNISDEEIKERQKYKAKRQLKRIKEER